ncbi:MAG: hypothetical protein Q3979_10150 [Actinomycetaceae bacterium]|nr:hypothetical protein [Actinomycetaceae bacterium]
MRTVTKQRTLLSACVVALSFLLCACEFRSIDTTVKVVDADNVTLTVDIMPSPSSNITKCSTFQTLVDDEEPIFGPGTVEPLSNSQAELSCRLSFETNAKTRNQHITESDGEITLTIPVDFWSNFDEGYAQDQGVTSIAATGANFSLTVEMPGKIVENSGGGQVEGNRVTWNSYESAKQGVSVTAERRETPTVPSSPPTTSNSEQSAQGASSNSSRTGLPAWAWIAACLLFAGAVAGFVLPRFRNRSQ